MNQRIYSLFFVFILLFSGSFLFAGAATGSKEGEKEEFDALTMINHHISDANEWHLMTLDEGGPDETHISIPLPVIIKDKEGFHFFMSSTIAHGHEHDGYTMDHGVVVSTKGLNRAQIPDLFSGAGNVFYDLSISKNVATLFISVTILFFVFTSMAKSYRTSQVPTGVGRFLEPIVVMVRDEIAIPNLGHKYKKFMPYLLTAFFFIWFNNMLGLVPFFPGGANFTGNIAVTMVLALFTLFMIVFNANKAYWKHIFMPPVPVFMWPVLIPLEFIGILTKPFALMMRLFANITAGHIMMLSIFTLIFTFKNAGLASVSVPLGLFVSFLETLVAFLQAYIFTSLSCLYIGMAVEDHHEEH